jgi:hypothetical protein
MNGDKGDKVPFFRSWTVWYLVVIGFLAVLIVLFYWITKRFA